MLLSAALIHRRGRRMSRQSRDAADVGEHDYAAAGMRVCGGKRREGKGLSARVRRREGPNVLVEKEQVRRKMLCVVVSRASLLPRSHDA